MILKEIQFDPEEIKPFVKLGEEDVPKLIPILKRRIPYSIFAHNAAILFPRFKERSAFFTLNGIISDSSWIVCLVFNEDYGYVYTMSAPENLINLPRSEALSIMENSALFQWHQRNLFTPTEKWLQSLIFEVSVNRKGNCVEFHPSHICWMEIKETLKMKDEEIFPKEPSVSVRRLSADSGTEFVMSNWKFAKEGTEEVIRRAIERNESAGVFVDGSPVSSVVVHPWGMLSALHTLPSQRNKGYAIMTMKYCMKELAKIGVIPASGVDFKNKPSLAFHQKLGCKLSGEIADYIICAEPKF